MLELYFVRPTTVDRIRASWMSTEIERYVACLHERHYARAYVVSRVQVLFHFGEFAKQRGVASIDRLPKVIEPFVRWWVSSRHRPYHKGTTDASARRTRRPLHAFLRLTLPKFQAPRSLEAPFGDQAPNYFSYLRRQRGLREVSLYAYYSRLQDFQAYLHRIGIRDLRKLTPLVVTAFITESGRRHGRRTVASLCSVLKSFLRYLFRQQLVGRDLSAVVEAPRHWRLAKIPRSISWPEVQRVLDGVDRRTPAGRRDYAVLLLLITYGLRGREIAALTLDDLDWKRERLYVLDRKGGHSTAYPLSTTVGEAIVDYLKHGRPKTDERRLFLLARAPYTMIRYFNVTQIAAGYLARAGIHVHRAGSHTLRHTCVQRLLDNRMPLKAIGDYVGHRSVASTRIYSKIDIEGLREVALGVGEAVL